MFYAVIYMIYMNNELINGDINSEWNHNNAHVIFNGMCNMTINNSHNNDSSFMNTMSLKKKCISNNVNILSKAYFANLNNKNTKKKKYFSKSSLTINTLNSNESSNNTLLHHNNKRLITHIINEQKSYFNLKTTFTNNKSHLSTLTSNSFLNNDKHNHNHFPKQHSYHHTFYKSNSPIQTSLSIIKNPFATIYGSSKYQ